MAKKQVIKINESQLKQVVTEIVKKMLKEETSDSWQHQDFDFSNACERICREIELGNYDNRITDAEWVEGMENKYENDNNGTVGNIRKAINDRLSMISTDLQYDGNYWQLIKNEYHNLCNLETKVPYHLKGEIHSMATRLQGMLSDIERMDTLSRI